MPLPIKGISNVKATDVSREAGTVYFEPVSGAGTYYVYYLPYYVKPKANYPNAVYLKWANKPADSWLAGLQNAQPVTATVSYLESINALNSFYPMEVIATDAEVKTIVEANSAKPYLVFPEDRLHPIKMQTDLPQRWVLKGVSPAFTDTASKGENFAYQLGVYAFADDLHNVKIKFSDLKTASGSVIPAKLFSCLNTDGINWDNSPLHKTVDVAKGSVQAMWCLATIPQGTATGSYTGTATVITNGTTPVTISITLVVNDKPIINGGVNEPWKQTRLSWLNSGMGQKNDIIKPYIPLKVTGNSISLLGRKMIIAPDGLPQQVETYFTEEMTSIGQTPRQVLASPFKWIAKSAEGNEIKWTSGKPVLTQTEAGEVKISASNKSANLLMKVNGFYRVRRVCALQR